MNEKRPDDLLSAHFDDEVSAQQRLNAARTENAYRAWELAKTPIDGEWYEEAPEPFEAGQYVADFRLAKDHAEAWWSSLLEAETQRLGGSGAAEDSMNQRWPFGPRAHPRVIAV